MDSVLRSLAIYFFLLLVFRLAGKRTLSETSNFELVVLLIISETIQQAMVDNDHSMTNAFLSIVTLLGASVAMSWLKQRFPALERWAEGTPMLLVENGRPNRSRMQAARIGDDEILAAARRSHGLERMDQIRHAVLEIDGGISIIPAKDAKAS
jgi:uncharacterized membrane protein YcaP (DUF421 family)